MGEFLSYISLPFLPVDITWPFPNFNRSHKLWALSSAILVPTVGIFTKIMSNWFNSVTVYNKEYLTKALDERPPLRPLLTVSNHYSCLDDPLLWGILDVRHLLRSRRMRWSLAAHDICFTNELHALFFALGQSIPIIRGNGVYQKAMDFAIERLNRGDWVHIFPEGKVNMDKELLRFKWGIDDVLPNEPPYVPKLGKKITVVIGKPIDLDGLRVKLRSENKTACEQRKTITDVIQEELWKLKDVAEILHRSPSTRVQ